MLSHCVQHGCSRTTSSTRRWIIIDGTDSDFWNCHDRHRIPPFLNRCQTGSSSSNRSATSGSCSFNHRLLYLSVPSDSLSSFVHRSLFARHALQVYSSSRRTKLSWFLLSTVPNCQLSIFVISSAKDVLTSDTLFDSTLISKPTSKSILPNFPSAKSHLQNPNRPILPPLNHKPNSLNLPRWHQSKKPKNPHLVQDRFEVDDQETLEDLLRSLLQVLMAYLQALWSLLIGVDLDLRLEHHQLLKLPLLPSRLSMSKVSMKRKCKMTMRRRRKKRRRSSPPPMNHYERVLQPR